MQRMGRNYGNQKIFRIRIHSVSCSVSCVKDKLTEGSGSRAGSGFPLPLLDLYLAEKNSWAVS